MEKVGDRLGSYFRRRPAPARSAAGGVEPWRVRGRQFLEPAPPRLTVGLGAPGIGEVRGERFEVGVPPGAVAHVGDALVPEPEPSAAAVDREVTQLKMRPGDRLGAVMQSTGLTEERIHEIARDNLRILDYLDQRFGTTVQVNDEEVARYYREHESEFTRGGDVTPFEEAEPVARQRASSERHRVTIDQWLRDLRARADISINPRVNQ